jgi:hypothetical protein
MKFRKMAEGIVIPVNECFQLDFLHGDTTVGDTFGISILLYMIAANVQIQTKGKEKTIMKQILISIFAVGNYL